MPRLLTVISAALVFTTASAGTLRFQQQGRLLDTAGTPVNGTQSLVVRLYSAATGGVPVWQTTYAGTPFSDGYFAVTLTGTDDTGRTLESAMAGTGGHWLTTDIGGGELSPRQAIAMSAEAGVAHAVAIVDQTQPCDLVGGMGYDNTTGNVVVCTGTTWNTIGNGACPAGTVDLGPVCMDAAPRAAALFDAAVSACMGEGKRVCSGTELLYGCENRAGLGLTVPDNTWLWFNLRTRLQWGAGNFYPAHHVAHRVGTKCYDNTTAANPASVTLSWDHGTVSYGYYCCQEQ